MLLIVTALKAEADSLIKLFGLQRTKDSFFSIYKNSDILLIISGISNINAAMAVTYAITVYGATKAINIGLCGSFDTHDKRGDIFDVKKVIEYHSNRVYHLKNEKRFAPSKRLFSFVSAQNDSSLLNNALADMESAGFYLSAAKLIDRKDIYILKVVSDHIDDKILSAAEVAALIKRHSPLYEKIANSLLSKY